TSLVEGAAEGGGQGASQQLARVRLHRQVVRGGEVVPALLLVRGAAGQVQDVAGRSVAVARGAAARQHPVGCVERAVVIAGGIRLRVEGGIGAEELVARGALLRRGGRRRVVFGGAVADPGLEGVEAAAREIQQRSAHVGDVGGDEQGLGVVPGG